MHARLFSHARSELINPPLSLLGTEYNSWAAMRTLTGSGSLASVMFPPIATRHNITWFKEDHLRYVISRLKDSSRRVKTDNRRSDFETGSTTDEYVTPQSGRSAVTSPVPQKELQQKYLHIDRLLNGSDEDKNAAYSTLSQQITEVSKGRLTALINYSYKLLLTYILTFFRWRATLIFCGVWQKPNLTWLKWRLKLNRINERNLFTGA